MKKDHLAQYGNVLLKRAWCSKCRVYSFIIDNERTCCCREYNDEIEDIKIMVAPRRKRKRVKNRKEILKKQNNKCYYCHNRLGYYYERNGRVIKSVIHFDHVIPFSFSHNSNEDNFVAACNLCNLYKSNLMFDTLFDAQEYLENAIKNKRIKILKMP